MRIRTLEELAGVAHALLTGLAPRKDGATLITLSGELGAGKTAFVKECARALGVEGEITSPTFVLEKIYALPSGNAFRHLIHIDAYRLADASEISALGFDELMQDSGNLVMIEWPERVAEKLPMPDRKITLSLLLDSARILEIQ